MLPRELLASATVPGGEELRLIRRGSDFMIMMGGNELMSSRLSGSEVALATMTAERLGERTGAHWLIGGYGMGFTLRAALATTRPDARLTVAELVPEIVEWARGPMAGLTGDCLDDPRVDVAIGDVGSRIAAGRAEYDAILLDVDNGPDGLSRPANDRLYSRAGLDVARAALRSGGILAIWSAGPDPRFARRLREAGFDVEEVVVGSRGGRQGARHTIWFAARG